MATEEIEAMTKVDEALRELEEDVRVRVLQWAVSKYAPAISSSVGQRHTPTTFSPLVSRDVAGGAKELPGIARLSDSGDFQLTVRDPKAKNTNDAAIRLVHVIV